MKLKDYVEQECIHYAKASKRLDISVSEYYALLNGKADPRISLIQRIEEFTKGNVKYKDWIGEYDPTKRKTPRQKKVPENKLE
jgi:transcriptional regulator with XRE-family HTH domain